MGGRKCGHRPAQKDSLWTQGRWPCEDRGRDWRFAATSQGTPGLSAAGRDEKRSLSGGFGGSMALPAPWFRTSPCQSCRTICFCCFKPPRLEYSVPAGLEHDTGVVLFPALFNSNVTGNLLGARLCAEFWKLDPRLQVDTKQIKDPSRPMNFHAHAIVSPALPGTAQPSSLPGYAHARSCLRGRQCWDWQRLGRSPEKGYSQRKAALDSNTSSHSLTHSFMLWINSTNIKCLWNEHCIINDWRRECVIPPWGIWTWNNNTLTQRGGFLRVASGMRVGWGGVGWAKQGREVCGGRGGEWGQSLFLILISYP